MQDRGLALKGVKHEIQALLICIIVGFVLGLCVCPVVRMLALTEWPTPGNNIKSALINHWLFPSKRS